MTILAVETSCDETSVAVVRSGRILSNVISSQIQLHAEYGGVVPELATREHLRNWLPVSRTALREASVEVSEIDAVAATRGPGLPNALMIGFKAGQALAFALRKPFLGIHHHEAHLYSPWVSGERLVADFWSFEPNMSARNSNITSLAPLWMMPPANASTKSPSSWDCRIPAGLKWIGWPKKAIRPLLIFPDRY
jgi:N6-L-threonylcarbamoyladenine synthase